MQTNRLSSVVWHCAGYNTRSIGVLILGNFDGPSYKGTQAVLDFQIENLEYLLNILLSNYRLNKQNIFGHNSFGKENCPGIIISNFLTALKENPFPLGEG